MFWKDKKICLNSKHIVNVLQMPHKYFLSAFSLQSGTEFIFSLVFFVCFRELHLTRKQLMEEHVKQPLLWRVTIRWSKVKRLKKRAKKMLQSSVSSATRALMFKSSVKMSLLSGFAKGSNKLNEYNKVD